MVGGALLVTSEVHKQSVAARAQLRGGAEAAPASYPLHPLLHSPLQHSSLAVVYSDDAGGYPNHESDWWAVHGPCSAILHLILNPAHATTRRVRPQRKRQCPTILNGCRGLWPVGSNAIRTRKTEVRHKVSNQAPLPLGTMLPHGLCVWGTPAATRFERASGMSPTQGF